MVTIELGMQFEAVLVEPKHLHDIFHSVYAVYPKARHLLQVKERNFRYSNRSSFNEWIKICDEAIHNFISGAEERAGRRRLRYPREDGLQTQSLTITFVTSQTEREQARNTAPYHRVRRHPWRFHHASQIYDLLTSSVVARQEFYELSSDLPLFSISPSSDRTSVLRFGIFVHNLEEMREFYRVLLQTQVSFEEPDFCCFNVGLHNGIAIQLTLKHSSQIDLIRTSRAKLIIKSRNCDRWIERTFSDRILVRYQHNILLNDPEGNAIIFEEVPEILLGSSGETYDSSSNMSLPDSTITRL